MKADDEGREAVVEALCSLNDTAKRCPHVIARLGDPPTMWDRRHLDVDALLDRLDEFSREVAHG